MQNLTTSMRLWKVNITHIDHVVFARNLWAMAESEVLDEAWRLFDPDRAISLFDTSYSSSADIL